MEKIECRGEVMLGHVPSLLKEAEMLEFCSSKTGLTKADIIRRGIKKIYDEIVLDKFKQ